MLTQLVIQFASLVGLDGITFEWLTKPLNMGLVQVPPLLFLELFVLINYIDVYFRLFNLYRRMFYLRPKRVKM